MKGKIRSKGNIMLATKLGEVLKAGYNLSLPVRGGSATLGNLPAVFFFPGRQSQSQSQALNVTMVRLYIVIPGYHGSRINVHCLFMIFKHARPKWFLVRAK